MIFFDYCYTFMSSLKLECELSEGRDSALCTSTSPDLAWRLALSTYSVSTCMFGQTDGQMVTEQAPTL